MKREFWVCVGALALVLGGAASGSADSVTMTAKLGKPVVMAGPGGKAYLKVGVKGIERGESVARTPVNVSLVLDRSSSMSGSKIAHAREAAIEALGRLDASDVVSVVVYDTTVHTVVPATRLTQRARIEAAIRQIQPRGTTALFAGVSRGAFEVRKHLSPDRVNRVVLLSDGLANVGPSSPGELRELGRSLAAEGISVTTLGLGDGYNEDLMTQLAMASDGNHAFVEHPEQLAEVFEHEFGDVLSVVGQQVRMDVRLSGGVTAIRALGRFADVLPNMVSARVGQVYADQEKYLLLELNAPPMLAGERRKVADVSIRYRDTASRTDVKQHSEVFLTATNDHARVEKSSDREVLIATTELLAAERNRLAIAMRDKGRIDEAQKLQQSNTEMLRRSSVKLKSSKLRTLRSRSKKREAELRDKKKWKTNRKRMRDDDFALESQQAW